jgi:hypothetical protein
VVNLRNLKIWMPRQKKLNTIEKLKNWIESFRMLKDKELKCKLISKMLTPNGLVSFKYSLLLWKVKVKKQKMTFCKSMNYFSRWQLYVINKKVYYNKDKIYCMKTLNRQRNKSLPTIFKVKFKTVIKWLRILKNKLKKFKFKLKK